MNTTTTTTKSAKRQVDEFDRRLHEQLRQTVKGDRDFSTMGAAYSDLIFMHFDLATGYGTVQKRFAAVIKAFPDHTDFLVGLRDEALTLLAAARIERDAEKVAKAGRKAAREASAKNVTSNGVKLGNVPRAAFDSLAALLQPIRVEYATRAEQMARAEIRTYAEKLEAAGGNFEAAFPARNRYAHSVARSLTESLPENWRLARMSESGKKRFAVQRKKEAQAVVDAFVIKLAQKIGKAVTGGSVSGSLWENSLLVVKCADGTEQRWRTHCILNQSCLGKLFNQWPTRLQ